MLGPHPVANREWVPRTAELPKRSSFEAKASRDRDHPLLLVCFDGGHKNVSKRPRHRFVDPRASVCEPVCGIRYPGIARLEHTHKRPGRSRVSLFSWYLASSFLWNVYNMAYMQSSYLHRLHTATPHGGPSICKCMGCQHTAAAPATVGQVIPAPWTAVVCLRPSLGGEGGLRRRDETNL